MRAVVYGLAGAVLWVVSTSAPAAAQERLWWGWALEELREAREFREYRDRREPRGRYDRRAHPRRTRGRDAGPPFCRSGRGHPVHGWAWCREKGFAPAAPPPVIWRRHHWDTPRFRRPVRLDPRRPLLSGVELRLVLGDLAYGSLTRHRHRLGAREPLVGRWHRPDRRTLVLQVRSGPFPVAELSDLDGDGRVDVVLLADR